MKLVGNVKQKKKLMVVLKKSRPTIQAKPFCGLAVPLSWQTAWTMLDLLLVPQHPKHRRMQRRWRVLVPMGTRKCQRFQIIGTCCSRGDREEWRSVVN